MARIFIVMVGLLYDRIVRGRKLSFEGRLNSWKSLMKKPGAHFYRNSSPFDLKISDDRSVGDQLPSRLDCNLDGWVHWVSRSNRVMTSTRIEDFSAFSLPRSLQFWAFCPNR